MVVNGLASIDLESGARHQTQLPKGTHPFQLYSMATPNGQKVTIMLEELLSLGVKEAEYDAHLIKIGEISLDLISLQSIQTQKSQL